MVIRGTNSRIIILNGCVFKKPNINNRYDFIYNGKNLDQLRKNSIIPHNQYISKDRGYYISKYEKFTIEDDVLKSFQLINKLQNLKLSGLDIKIFNWYSNYKTTFLKFNINSLEYKIGFQRAEKYLLSIIEENKWVASHNDLTINNLVKLKDKIFMIDLEYLSLNHYFWDKASYMNHRDMSIRKKYDQSFSITNPKLFNQIRFLHSFIWYLKFYTFDKSKRTINENYVKYFKIFKKQWLSFLFKKTQKNYWNKRGIEFSAIFKGKKIGNYEGDEYENELKLLYIYLSRDFFLKHFIWLEGIVRNHNKIDSKIKASHFKEEYFQFLGSKKYVRQWNYWRKYIKFRNKVVHGDASELKIFFDNKDIIDYIGELIIDTKQVTKNNTYDKFVDLYVFDGNSSSLEARENVLKYFKLYRKNTY